MMRRIYLHRGLWSMQPQILHMAIGALFTLLVALFLVYRIELLWDFQKTIIQKLLAFAEVPYRTTRLPYVDLKQGIPVYYQPGGNTFIIPVKYQVLGPNQALLAIAVLVALGFVSYRFKIVPLPFKVLILFLLTLIIATILYTTFVSALPPHTINKLAIDWQYSGSIILLLIAVIFTFSVFPVKGPLWVKLLWLTVAFLYAITWNTVRISVVLSSLYYLGSFIFLLAHYLTGIYIDFLYIVAIYSLALAHLARLETSEVGW